MNVFISRRHLLGLTAGLIAACATPSPTTTPSGAAPAAGAAGGPNPPVPAAGSPLDAVIAGAKREGTVNWAITPDLVDGAQQLRDLVKAKYGVDLQVNANPQLNYTEKTAKAIQELQAGAAASFDLLDLSDSSLTPMLANKAAKMVDWAQYAPAVTNDAVVSGTLLVTRDSFLLPAYNPTVIPTAQAPKSYDDLIDPKWHGKVTVINALTNWTWLAQPGLWGEEKLVDYMRKLFAQDPAIDRYAGMLSRLLSGEYPIASGLDSGSVWLSQRKGQPIAAIPISPIRDARYGSVVAGNAQSPNAAILLSLVQVMPEGQAIMDQVTAQSAAWIKGTTAAKFVAENTIVPVDLDFQAANQDRIVKRLEQVSRG